MNQVLSDIKSVGGVVGCFLYDAKAGVAASDVPAVFKPAKLAEVGRSLAKTLKAANLANPGATDLSLYYEEILVVAREVAKGSVLVVLCDPAMNVNLLSMSINLSMDELVELAGAATASGAPEPRQPEPAKPASAPAPSKAAKKAVLYENGYRELHAALAKVVGPMAAIILADAREKWEAGGGDADALLALLKAEIGDSAKAERFASLAEPTLKRLGGSDG